MENMNMPDHSGVQQLNLLANKNIKEKNYWLKTFAGDFSRVNFPYDHEKTKSEHGSFKKEISRFDEQVFSRLIKISGGSENTLFVILLAGMMGLLNKYTGCRDLTVGTSIFKQEFEGKFINSTLPLRAYVYGEMTFKQLLLQVRQVFIGANENQNYPVENLLYQLNIDYRADEDFPLFDIAVLMENIHDKRYLQNIRLNMICSFTVDDNHLECLWEYNAHLFETSTILRLIDHFNRFMQEAVANLDESLVGIEILAAAEKQRMLVELNKTESEYPADQAVHRLYEKQVIRSPFRMAVYDEDREMTYDRLNQMSDQLAGLLRQKGSHRDSIIVLMLERSIETLIGILAILKSGAAFLPIDLELPGNRIQFMVKDSGAELCLTTTSCRQKAPVPAAAIALDDGNMFPGTQTGLTCTIDPTDTAYLIYTSGTTGNPKAVMIAHRGLVNYVHWAAGVYVRNEAVNFPLFTSAAFDLTLTSIFTPLVTGNAIVVYPDDAEGMLIERIIDENRVGVIKLTPSHLKLLRDTRGDVTSPSLKRLILGGEVLETELVRSIYENFGSPVEIYNEYGPTEAVVGCMIYRFEPGKNYKTSIPIGSPVDNARIYILDENVQPVPIGVPGELFIGGHGVARGYLNQVGMTAKRFIESPFGHDERLYKTGDICRFSPDGNVEFLGRRDDQVKVRGYRIELEEIENRLVHVPEIREAVVVARTRKNGEMYLTAYIAAAARIDVSKLKEDLHLTLPDYMVPAYFVQVEQIPLTQNGKIDRKALPEPDLRSAEEYVAPDDEIELRLADIWSDVLGLNREIIGKYANFFDLNGHSLNAAQLMARIHKLFDVRVNLKEIFENPTIHRQASLIKQSKKERHFSLKVVEDKEFYRLSSAQKRLYILQKTEGQNLSYNMPTFMELSGKIDREKLAETFASLVNRHDSLRTSFEVIEGETVQRIHDKLEFQIEYHDLSNRGSASGSEKNRIIQNFVKYFDPSKAPLMRVGLIKIDEGKHTFMFDMHHIVTDGVSQSIFSNEFISLYSGKVLAPLKLQYRDYSEWLNSNEIQAEIRKQEQFWLEEFQGELPILDIPTDYPRPKNKSFEGARINFTIDREETKALRELARQENATLFMLLLAVYFVFIQKITNQEDIIVGTGVAGRNHTDLEHIIGMFVNTIALRNHVAPQQTFRAFLKELRERTIRAFENQDYLFENLVDKVVKTKDRSRNPIFDVEFSLNNIEARPQGFSDDMAGLKLKPYGYESLIAKFDIYMNVLAGDMLFISIEYCTKLFKKETMERFVKYFRKTAGAIIDEPGLRLSRIEIIHDEEKRQILFEFNNTRKTVVRDKCFHQLFEARAAGHAPRVAAVHGDQQLSYGELNSRANRLARLLRQRGVKRNSLAAVYCNRSHQFLTGILGIFKAGGAYLPLDLNSPPERTKKILRDSGVRYLLTTSDSCPDIYDLYSRICSSTEVRDLIFMDEVADLPQKREIWDTFIVSSAQRLYRFLQAKQLAQAGPIGILFTNPIYKITALAALRSLGGDYTEIEDSMRRDEKKKRLKDLSIHTMITESSHVGEVDQLFWELDSLENYIVLDEYDIKHSEQEGYFKDIWNFVAEKATWAVNDYGWNSSYTDEPFPVEEMQEYIDNFKTKITPYLTPECRVLEIGCGHGLVLFEIAPRVGYYLATDLSEVIIERNRQRLQAEGLAHVDLLPLGASEIDAVESRDFDIVLCSSVTHYFPDTVYLETVIKSAIDLLKDDGIIYLDDMLDLSRKQEFIHSVQAYKRLNPGAPVKTDWQSDLFIGRDFFQYMQQRYPEITCWQASNKLGTIENELINYRYDVILKIKKTVNRGVEAGYSRKNRFLEPEIKNYPGQDVNTAQSFTVAEIADLNTFRDYPKEDPENLNEPGDLSYIIYTSGSTGIPKGAMIHHLGMINHLYAKINDLAITRGDIMAQTASPCFDISVWQFLVGLLVGARLIIIDRAVVMEPLRFLRVLQGDRITIWESVPSLINAFLDAVKPIKNKNLPHLRWMIATGEALNARLAQEWHRVYPDIKVLNAYGPTEASDDVTHHLVDVDVDRITGSISIGRPIQNMHVYVLDKNLHLCPVGVKGELCVSGPGIGMGYLQDIEKTAENFSLNPYYADIKNGDHYRLYRTGDLGFSRADGTIEFIGREDQQVKIRGNRIELKEIENELIKYKEIKEAAVIVRDGQGEEKLLFAYIVSRGDSVVKNQKIDISKVREFLSVTLPDQMIPNYFVQLREVPLTLNGKIDRKALHELEIKSEERLVAPTDVLEEKLVKIWSEVLEIDRDQISTDISFFELNGNSLRSIMLISKIYKELSVSIPLTDIFNLPTVKAMARYIREAAESHYYAIEPVEEREYYQVSSAQKRLYILQQMDKTSTIYNVYMLQILEFKVNLERLEKAVIKLVNRHDSLRTSFIMAGTDPVQKIFEPVKDEFNIEYFDLGSCPDTRAQEESERETVTKFVRPFNLDEAPLLRVGLIETGETRSVLMIDLHHIITDATSRSIFLKELLNFYAGREMPELKLQYKDYSEWQNSLKETGSLKKQEIFWLEQLSDIPILDLPTDNPRPPVQSFEGRTMNFEIGGEEVERLNQIVRDREVTLFILMLSIYYIFLFKISGQLDISVGTVIAGRTHPDLENIMGMFVNTLVLRNQMNEDQAFYDFLEILKERTLEAFDNQDYQFEDLVNEVVSVRDVSRNPIFDVGFVVYNIQVKPGILKDEKTMVLKPRQYEYESTTSKFDLTLFCVEEGDRLSFTFEYCTRLFSPQTINTYITFLKSILMAVINNPDVSLSDIDILSKENRETILGRFNDTKREYPGAAPMLHELFEKQSRQGRGKAAVVFEDIGLTYGELDQRADRLAVKLRGVGVGTGDIVAIMLAPSLELVIGIMGILKSGAAYLPIDPAYPDDRKTYMLKDSGVGVLISDNNEKWPVETSIQVNGEPVSPSAPPGVPDIAYVIYTSGTTGRPKGVMVEHRSVVNTLLCRKDYYKFDTTVVTLQLFSFAFDGFVTSFFTPITAGAAVILLGSETLKDLSKIRQSIVTNRVTHLLSFPTLFQHIIENLTSQECASLKTVTLAGEKVALNLLELTWEKNKHIEIMNEYGVTEASVMSTIYKFKEEDRVVKIGTPAWNTSIYFLDSDVKLQPIGIFGELCISGSGVARGYLNNPMLTAAKFVPDPLCKGNRMYKTGDIGRWLPCGNIQFSGRVDRQVKIRGFRIELAEIEQRLLLHDGVKEAVAVANMNNGSRNLYAYIVPHSAANLNASDLKEYLSIHLPSYMIPDHFVQIDSIPLTPNGKVDVKSLGTVGRKLETREQFIAPTNELEALIASIWKSVLLIDRVGINDNFFDLGGNSLNIVQVNNRLKEELKRDIPIVSLFQYPTVHSLGKYLRQENSDGDTRDHEREETRLKELKDSIGKTIDIFKEM
jgi:amino acid adenylation domain-containing protein